MKRLRIEHLTEFDYESPVAASYNEARMIPRSTQNQFVLSSALEISPSSSENHYIDYFGTHVVSFDVLSGHSELSITARSLVEVRAMTQTRTELGWEDLRLDATRRVDRVEMLAQTHFTRPHPELVAIARSTMESDTPFSAVRVIAEHVRDAVAYMPGSTGVHSTADEAWEARSGVCQDIAHITLGALRAAGVPARYVSGYLHPKPDAEVGESVIGESHAWVEWFVGDWCGFDPTNGLEIGDRHVRVGHGRDYTDVPPLLGVYAGSPRSDMRVGVTITREA